MAPSDHRSPAPTPRGGEGALRVTVVDRQGRRIRAAGLTRWLAAVAPVSARGSVTVALVADARVRALNHAYRKKDHATDVLSFPSEAAPRTSQPAPRTSHPAPRTSHPAPRTRFLGDIVIATGVAKRQARDAGHDEATELRILALHGLLHLLGYDHERDAGLMERTERRLRRKGGLREGLIERAGTAAGRKIGAART